MATATHIPATLGNAQGKIQPGQYISFSNSGVGVFVCGLLTTQSGLPPMGSSGIQFVSSLPSEASFSGYSRQSLTGISWAYDTSGVNIDWTFNNITFSQQASDPGTNRYGFIAYTAQGSGDANTPVVCILDFGQNVSTANGSLVLQSPSSGLISYTGFG